jgi:aspartokinase-like uncharacterized kinase
VKIGGSLLDWPLLPTALTKWLAAQRPAAHVLICGGGRFADLVRQADAQFELGDEAAHWLAVECMSLSAKLLAALVPEARLVDRYAALMTSIEGSDGGVVIYDVCEFLREHEPRLPGVLLPHDWTSTSDSIAARLAEVLRADEVVLLKSGDPPGGTVAKMAEDGYVDAHFPAACRNVPSPRFVNLRQAG